MRRLFWAVLAGLWVFPAHATELKGMYDPAKMVETFALIGPAQLGVDDSGTVQKVLGEVQTDAGVTIPYEALFMLCKGTRDACANVHMRHDWYAQKEDVWCAINAWKALPDYKNRAHAAYAFDKVRLIREQVGFVGATVEPRWKFVQFWRQELEAFHAITKDCNGAG